MNKLYKYISLAAAVLGLAACTKELATDDDNQIIKTDETLYEVNLGAAIGGTKTSMGSDANGSVLWSENDQISVTINSGTARTFTVSAGKGTTSATFTGLVSADEKAAIEANTATLEATYPASGAEVPGTQTFVDGNFADGMFPMTGKGTGASLTFSNPASIVMAKDVKVGTATSAVLNYTVGSADKTVTISNISGVAEADLLFVVEAGADAESFTLTLDGSSFAHQCYTSATTAAGKRYNLKLYTCKIEGTQYKTLALAVAAVPTDGTETTIQMIANETFAENTGVTIAKTQKVALDLNGKVIGNNITVEKASATITNNGYLTIEDLSANADGIITNGATEEATGDWWSDPQKNWATNTITNYGTLVLKSGNIQNTATGISYCVDNSSNGVDATFEMKGGKIKDIGCAMRLHCNSDEYLNKVIISGGVIESIGSQPFWVQLPGGGSKKVCLEISDGEFKGSSAYCWYDWAESGNYDNASYSITGGKFVGGIYTYKQNYKFITGGLFDSKSYDDGTDKWELSSMVADGYIVTENTDASTSASYPWKVVEDPSVAQVGDTKYTDLHEALEEAKTAGKTCTLLRDVDLTGVEWTPVADFNVTFDGNDKTISNLTVIGEGNLGLFASTGTSATIKDLTITGAKITSTSGRNHGVLAGSVSGSTVTGVTIQNSTVTADGGQYTGGMFGQGYPAASECTVTGCTVTGYDQVGGMIGFLWVGHIESCTVTDNSVIATSERAGGLVGKVEIASGNLGSSTMWIDGNTISATKVQAPDYAGGIAGQIMGDVDYYSISNNTIDIESFGETTSKGGVTNPIATLRPSQNAAFTGALAKNITGNTWSDETLNADYFVYTNVASGVEHQIISRVGFNRDADGVYHISDLAGLKVFRDAANSAATNFESKTIVIDNTVQTIDLQNEEWVPINSSWNPGFTFDGNGCVIKNLKVDKISNPSSGDDPKKYAGLFGSAFCSTIKNLTVDGADVKGIGYVAAIAGHGDCAHFINCTVYNANITSQVDNNDDGDKAGAICGYLAGESDAEVTNCTADKCTITAYRDLGSLVGMANGTAEVKNSSATNCSVVCKTDVNYKGYKTKAEFDANEVIGETNPEATVSDVTYDKVTVSYVPDFTNVGGTAPSLGGWQ